MTSAKNAVASFLVFKSNSYLHWSFFCQTLKFACQQIKSSGLIQLRSYSTLVLYRTQLNSRVDSLHMHNLPRRLCFLFS